MFSQIAPLIYPLFFFFALFFAIFLTWRAFRHEFFSSQEAYDLLLVGGFGAIFFARLFDFLLKGSTDGLSLVRLLFFNRYGGFNYWGVLLGIYIGLFVYLKSKKTKLWFVLDLFAAPLAFAQTIIFLGGYFENSFVGGNRLLQFLNFFSYLLLFVALKRLSAKKKHVGFFASFYLVFSSLIVLLGSRFANSSVFVLNVSREVVISSAFIIVGLVNWYFLAKRNVVGDLKGSLAFVLLSLFRIKRMLFSANEAGNFSKSVIFAPYNLLILTWKGVLIVAHEVKLSFFELLYVFGFRKFFK